MKVLTQKNCYSNVRLAAILEKALSCTSYKNQDVIIDLNNLLDYIIDNNIVITPYSTIDNFTDSVKEMLEKDENNFWNGK